MRRKGQAAMEFLMTYGWAILVVLAAIGALAYFGILSPSKFLPSSFTMTGGISAGEYKVSAGMPATLTFGIINNIGDQITINETDVNTTNLGSAVDCQIANTTQISLANGQKQVFTFSCTNTAAANVGDKFKANVNVIYTKNGEDVTHTASGSITSSVEQ